MLEIKAINSKYDIDECKQFIEKIFKKRCDSKPYREFARPRLDAELKLATDKGLATLYGLSKITEENKNAVLLDCNSSIHSSFIAFLLRLTPINPLPAHYYCENCTFFSVGNEKVQTGIELPDETCPICRSSLIKRGFNLDFKSFWGNGTDKKPFVQFGIDDDVYIHKEFCNNLTQADAKLFNNILEKNQLIVNELKRYALETRISPKKINVADGRFWEKLERIHQTTLFKIENIHDLIRETAIKNNPDLCEINRKLIGKGINKNLLITTREDAFECLQRFGFDENAAYKISKEISKGFIKKIYQDKYGIAEIDATLGTKFFENAQEAYELLENSCIDNAYLDAFKKISYLPSRSNILEQLILEYKREFYKYQLLYSKKINFNKSFLEPLGFGTEIDDEEFWKVKI